MSKITVIGAGSVGATIANDLMIQGISTEILLIDINREKAFGEALDIYQGAPFCSPAIVRSGDYEDAEDSDIVIITSGLPRKAGQSRLELAQAQIRGYLQGMKVLGFSEAEARALLKEEE